MLLSNPFRPDPRVHKEALSLASKGYVTTIIAWDRESKYNLDEKIGDITVKRTGPKSGYGNLILHLVNLPRFWLNAFFISRKIEEGIIHAHDFDTLPVGVFISKLKGAPLIYDAHESYGLMIEGGGVPKWIGKLIDFLEILLVSYASKVIVVNPRLHVYGGIYPAFKKGRIQKPALVMNCRVPTDQPSRTLSRDILKIGYVGVLEKGRCLMESVNAFGGLPKVTLHIRGFGSEMQSLEEAGRKYSNVNIEGPIHPDEIFEFYSKCNIVLNMVNPLVTHEKVGVHNRLFDAMAAGRALIVSKGTYAEELVHQLNCGVSAEPTESGIRETINLLIKDTGKTAQLGESGRIAFDEKYNWNRQEEVLFKVYHEI
jgi:glycosyltransferase involved in cell wall biosynthesis